MPGLLTKMFLVCLGISMAAGSGNGNGNGGSVEGCTAQDKCFDWDYQVVQKGDPANKCGQCAYKVCMKTTFGGSCAKPECETMSHACGSSTGCGQCNPPIQSPLESGTTMCQYGTPGTTLLFVLKDGSTCPDSLAYSLNQGNLPAQVNCYPERAGQGLCGGKGAKECVWEFTVPSTCGSVTPNPSASPASRSPSPRPAQSPVRAECLGCAAESDQCIAVDANLSAQGRAPIGFAASTLNGADMLRTIDPTGEYGCKVNPNCKLIECDKFVPQQAYDEIPLADC